MAGATAVTAGLSALAVRHLPMASRPVGPWLLLTGLVAALYCAALTAADLLAESLSNAGWATTDTFVLKVLAGVPTAVLALCLVCAVAWYLTLARPDQDSMASSASSFDAVGISM